MYTCFLNAMPCRRGASHTCRRVRSCGARGPNPARTRHRPKPPPRCRRFHCKHALATPLQLNPDAIRHPSARPSLSPGGNALDDLRSRSLLNAIGDAVPAAILPTILPRTDSQPHGIPHARPARRRARDSNAPARRTLQSKTLFPADVHCGPAAQPPISTHPKSQATLRRAVLPCHRPLRTPLALTPSVTCAQTGRASAAACMPGVCCRAAWGTASAGCGCS